ncbi:MAG: SRPBCC family protein [Actinomycetota bacterium]
MSAPNWRSMAAVDKAGYGLHPVALTEWHGLVWLNLADDPALFEEQVWSQLDYRLDGDRAKFARYDLAGLVAGKRVDYTVAANWKIIQENFQECYHCNTIHPELVDTLPQFRDISGLGGTYSADGYNFAEDKASFSVSGSAVLPRLPGLEDRDDRKYLGMVIRPNCFLSLLPDHVIVHRFEAVSPELTTVVCEWLFPPETVAAHDTSDTVELFHRVNQQDFAASQWCQPNMRSRAYAGGGVLVPTEQEIIGRWYYDWYRESMGLGTAALGDSL